MRRCSPEGAPDAGEVAQVAQEAAWWAERAAVDQPLTLDEFRRYAALTAQRVDVEAALRAVLPDVCAPAVARSRSEHAHEEYRRASKGHRRPVAGL